MYLKGKAYWYSGTKPWTNLGRNIGVAFQRYNELEMAALAVPVRPITFAQLSAEYLIRGTADLAPRTKKDYFRYVERLNKAFGHMPLEDIEPGDIEEYHSARGQKAKVQANREKAVLSALWNWARRKRLTALPNPTQGVRRHREVGRKVLVDDVTYWKVWSRADWDVRDVLDLALLTGQRPADVLNLDWSQVHGDELWVRQGKTGAVVRFAIDGELGYVLNDISLRHGRVGRIVRISAAAFDNRFEHDRRAAKVSLDAFQFRDLRAKAITEVADGRGEDAAQAIAGHKTAKTTALYVRRHAGRKTRSVR